ncbi:MAG: hypothetical protein M5R36_16425 [Deltaproteobacteria bacterium]|nr:hypothetical protein [Deltaproteobacteria bacterium]
MDGKTRYTVRYDTLDYADKTVSELDYHYDLKETEAGVFHRLYRHSVPAIFHPEAPGGDLSDLAPGDHTAEVVARDAAGNTSLARFPFRVEAPPPPAAKPPEAEEPAVRRVTGLAAVSFREDTLIVDTTRETGVAPDAAAAVFHTHNGDAGDAWIDGGLVLAEVPAGFSGVAEVAWRAGGGMYRWSGEIDRARNGGRIRSADGRAEARVAPSSLFKEFPVMVGRGEAPAAPGLTPVSPLYTFNRPWEPIRRKLRVSIGGGGKGAGIYLYDRGTWWHLAQGTSTAATHFGSYALMRDTAPPVIGEARVETLRGRPVPVVDYVETGSGIPEGGVALTLDSRRVLAELMPVVGRVRYIPETPLAPGTHELTLTLTDRAGLSASKSFSLTIP